MSIILQLVYKIELFFLYDLWNLANARFFLTLCKNLSLTNYDVLHDKGLKCFPVGHLRPTLAFCHRGSGNSTGPLSAVLQAAFSPQLSASVRSSCYVSSATRELCILHKAIVATGPLAHELGWTKLCSLDLRWATGPNLAQLELIVTDLIPQRILSRGIGPLASSLHSAFKPVLLLTPAY